MTLESLQRTVILIEAYAASADAAAAHARGEATSADGTARRLWQEEEMRERVRAWLREHEDWNPDTHTGECSDHSPAVDSTVL
jgi:hypothetical protein